MIVAIGRQIRKPAELHRECRRPVFNPRISFLMNVLSRTCERNLRNLHDHPIPSMYALYLGYLGVIIHNGGKVPGEYHGGNMGPEFYGIHGIPKVKL